jgi:hypothetical protein
VRKKKGNIKKTERKRRYKKEGRNTKEKQFPLNSTVLCDVTPSRPV